MSSDAGNEDFEDIEPANYPQFARYYRRPTLVNAVALLKALGIHVPYSSFETLKRKRTPPSSAARRGGGGATEAFELHAAADFLHDLKTDSRRIRGILIQDILPAHAPPAFLKAVKKLGSRAIPPQEFTWKMSKHLAGVFGLSEKLFKTKTAREKRAADGALYEIVTSWMTPVETTIVLDGVLYGPDLTTPFETAMEMRTLTMYAFLMILIDAYAPPSKNAADAAGTAVAVKQLKFLTGVFQTADISKYNTFMVSWIRHLMTDTRYVDLSGCVVLEYLSLCDTPVPYDPTVVVEEDALVVDGRRIPFSLPVNRIRKALSKMDKPVDILRAYAKYVYVGYPKSFLLEILDSYTDLSDAERQDPVIKNLLATLVKINAFRDAYKADVAIRRGAVYITVDRLAQMYYALRAREQKAAHRGIWLNPRGPNEFFAMMYEQKLDYSISDERSL